MNRIILLLLAAGVAAVLVLSPRSWSMANTLRIQQVGILPETPAVDYALEGLYPAMVLPYLPGEAQARSVASLTRQRDRRLGIAYREVSIVKMPVWAYEEGGLVAYRELRGGYSVEPLGPQEIAGLEAATGQNYGSRRFSLLPHLWGWLFAAGFLFWWFVANREEARRAAASEFGEAGPELA
jgi:hypothetical protein